MGIGDPAVFIGAICPQRHLQVNAGQDVRNVHTIQGLHNCSQAGLVAGVEFIELRPACFPFTSQVHDKFDLAVEMKRSMTP